MVKISGAKMMTVLFNKTLGEDKTCLLCCCCQALSRVRLFVTLWIVAHHAPRSTGFSRHYYWRGLPFPSPGDLPHPGIKPRSPAL